MARPSGGPSSLKRKQGAPDPAEQREVAAARQRHRQGGAAVEEPAIVISDGEDQAPEPPLAEHIETGVVALDGQVGGWVGNRGGRAGGPRDGPSPPRRAQCEEIAHQVAALAEAGAAFLDQLKAEWVARMARRARVHVASRRGGWWGGVGRAGSAPQATASAPRLLPPHISTHPPTPPTHTHPTPTRPPACSVRDEVQQSCAHTREQWRQRSAVIQDQRARLAHVKQLVGRLGLRVEQGGAELCTASEDGEPAPAL